MTEVTEEMVEAFKRGWEVADVQGDAGNRVRRGLKAALAATAQQLVLDSSQLEAAHRAYYEDENAGFYYRMECAIRAALTAPASAERPSDRQCPHMPEGVEKRAGACHRCAVEAGWTGAPAVPASAEPSEDEREDLVAYLRTQNVFGGDMNRKIAEEQAGKIMQIIGTPASVSRDVELEEVLRSGFSEMDRERAAELIAEAKAEDAERVEKLINMAKIHADYIHGDAKSPFIIRRLVAELEGSK